MTNFNPVRYVDRRAMVVWTMLVGLTLLTWIISTDHIVSPSAGTATVLALAFVKVRFIGSDFMDLRHTPRILSAAFDALLLALYAALVVLYVVL